MFFCIYTTSILWKFHPDQLHWPECSAGITTVTILHLHPPLPVSAQVHVTYIWHMKELVSAKYQNTHRCICKRNIPPNTQVLLQPPATTYHLLLPFSLCLFFQIQLLSYLFHIFSLLLFSFQILGNLLQGGRISKWRTKTNSISFYSFSFWYHALKSLFFLLSISSFSHPIFFSLSLNAGKLHNFPVFFFHLFLFLSPPHSLLFFKFFNICLSCFHFV